MIKLKQILLENPDKLNVYPFSTYESTTTFPFTYFINSKNVYFGDKNTAHGSNSFNLASNGKFEKELDKNNIEVYDRGEYDGIIIDGRLFSKHKIITLWYYPTKKIFFEMIKSLEKKLKHSLSVWNIEVYNYAGFSKIEKGSFEHRIYDDFMEGVMETKLINVKDYK